MSLPTDLLQDEDLCDQILQKIAADVDTYAGKIVSNVDLWAEVFILLQTADIQKNFDPLNGDLPREIRRQAGPLSGDLPR